MALFSERKIIAPPPFIVGFKNKSRQFLFICLRFYCPRKLSPGWLHLEQGGSHWLSH